MDLAGSEQRSSGRRTPRRSASRRSIPTPLLVGWRENGRYALLAGFLLLCFLGGGASRYDVLSLLYVRPAAILCIAGFLLIPGSFDAGPYKRLFQLLGILAAIISLQLIPLPPDLWLSLPGHARYAQIAAAAGVEQPWRPLSLTPDLTLNSLLSLLPGFAILVAFAGLRESSRQSLVILLLGVALLSAILGVFQLVGDPTSPLYFYDITTRGVPVGLFANRNHQAALLAVALPMLRVWTLMPTSNPAYRLWRSWVALASGLFLLAMILVTGSRAGMLLALIALAISYAIAPVRWPIGRKWERSIRLSLLAGLPLALAAAVIGFGRAIAIQRLLAGSDYDMDARIQFLPVTTRIIRDFFPFGSGFGSFDPVFRGYEPDADLTQFYFNHAHNDLLELVLTGGLPALLLLIAFLFWLLRSSLPLLRKHAGRSQAILFGRLGAGIALLLLIASLMDYPLRTPIMSVVLAVAASWIASATTARQPDLQLVQSDQ